MSSFCRLFQLLLTATALLNPAAAWPGQGYKITFDAQTFQANNAVSIDQFDGDVAGFEADGERLYALVDNSVSIRAEKAGFALQAYKKQEVFLASSNATAQLFSDINSDVLRNVTRSYPIDFKGYGVEQTGIEIEKAIEFKPTAAVSPARLAAQVRVYNSKARLATACWVRYCRRQKFSRRSAVRSTASACRSNPHLVLNTGWPSPIWTK